MYAIVIDTNDVVEKESKNQLLFSFIFRNYIQADLIYFLGIFGIRPFDLRVKFF